jgi:histidinol phosphatase-like enzyme
MIERAERDFSINLEKSWMIGDKAIDVETGFNAKTKTVLVKTGYGREEAGNLRMKPDVVSENLLFAVREILKEK